MAREQLVSDVWRKLWAKPAHRSLLSAVASTATELRMLAQARDRGGDSVSYHAPVSEVPNRLRMASVGGDLPATWLGAAACRKVDTGIFFPRGTPNFVQVANELAKAVCATCPVRSQCLSFALSTDQEYGVWGGYDEKERHVLIHSGERLSRSELAAIRLRSQPPSRTNRLVMTSKPQARSRRVVWLLSGNFGDRATYARYGVSPISAAGSGLRVGQQGFVGPPAPTPGPAGSSPVRDEIGARCP
jgi:WhiB family redox-sensing transcriptional regulator